MKKMNRGNRVNRQENEGKIIERGSQKRKRKEKLKKKEQMEKIR